MASGIYAITNTITGEQYIGSSARIAQRWSQHRALLRAGKHSNIMLQRAWNQRGESTFAFSIIECTDDLREREAFHVESLRPAFNVQSPRKGNWTAFSTSMSWHYQQMLLEISEHIWKPQSQWLDVLMRRDKFIADEIAGRERDEAAWRLYLRQARERHYDPRVRRPSVNLILSAEVISVIDRIAPLSRGAYVEGVLAELDGMTPEGRPVYIEQVMRQHFGMPALDQQKGQA